MTTGAGLDAVDYVSGMALATGDFCIRHKQTPAASAVPLTEESLTPRYWGRPSGDIKDGGLQPRLSVRRSSG